MPDKIFIPTATKPHRFSLPHDGFSGSSYESWHFYVDVLSLEGAPVPIYANVRKPALGTPATEDMQATLNEKKLAPRFWAYNGGLVVLAERAHPCTRKGRLGMELEIPKRYGLVNGGHTQLAIDAALKAGAPTNAWVRVEAIAGAFTDEEIAAIAEARNTSKNVRDTSVAWKQGKFNALKKSMRPEFEVKIDWTENLRASEGLEAECRGDQLIQLLMLFDQDYDVNRPPMDYVRSLGKPFDAWKTDPSRFAYLDVVCDEILELHDTILSSFDTKPKTPGLLACTWGGKVVFSGKRLRPTPFLELKPGRRMDDGILFPILSAFRVLLEHDKATSKVRWSAPPLQVWALAKRDMMDLVKDSVKGHKGALQVRYDLVLWKSLGRLVEKHKAGLHATSWKGY